MVDLRQYGNPIYSGMSANEIYQNITTMANQDNTKAGHHYFSPMTPEGDARRLELTKWLFEMGGQIVLSRSYFMCIAFWTTLGVQILIECCWVCLNWPLLLRGEYVSYTTALYVVVSFVLFLIVAALALLRPRYHWLFIYLAAQAPLTYIVVAFRANVMAGI